MVPEQDEDAMSLNVDLTKTRKVITTDTLYADANPSRVNPAGHVYLAEWRG